MIKPRWFELPMSRTNFYGPKDVRAIEVRLFIETVLTATATENCQSVVNSADPGHVLWRLIWVYTVCKGPLLCDSKIDESKF